MQSRSQATKAIECCMPGREGGCGSNVLRAVYSTPLGRALRQSHSHDEDKEARQEHRCDAQMQTYGVLRVLRVDRLRPV